MRLPGEGPRRAPCLFSERAPGSGHVRDHGLTGDERIWSLAKEGGFFIITKDGDFPASVFVRGHPPQVVEVSLSNTSTRQIADVLLTHLDNIEQFAAKS